MKKAATAVCTMLCILSATTLFAQGSLDGTTWEGQAWIVSFSGFDFGSWPATATFDEGTVTIEETTFGQTFEAEYTETPCQGNICLLARHLHVEGNAWWGLFEYGLAAGVCDGAYLDATGWFQYGWWWNDLPAWTYGYHISFTGEGPALP